MLLKFISKSEYILVEMCKTEFFSIKHTRCYITQSSTYSLCSRRYL